MSMGRVIGFCALALLLAGCGESGRLFGFDRSGPDEFTVVRNAPLSVPPNATLRPPQGSAQSDTRNESSEAARASLLSSGPGDGVPAMAQATTQSPGEIALARRATAYYGVEADIRRVVNEESSQLVRESRSFTDKLVFWKDPEPPGTIIDAAAESRRLRENEALGKPLNSGAAPTIVRRKSGVSSLF